MLVPKLRFKEFNDEWKKVKINKILKIKHGKNQKEIECINGKYPILGTGGIIGTTNTPAYLKESVLIGRKGTIDKPMYINIPFWTVDTLFYSDVSSKYNVKFIYYLFNTINWKKYDESTGVPSLSANTIENIDVNISLEKEEQLKISQFLSLVDKKIELQQRKIEVLKMYKKGLSDNIYASLKEKIIELNNYAIVQGGFAFKSELFQKKGKPIVRISNIYNNLVDLNDLVYYDSALEIDKKFYVNDSDLLIAMSGATTGKYGIYHNTYPAYLNQRVGKIICKKDTILYYPYLYFLFGLTAYEKQLQSRLIAGAQPNISPADIESMKFKFPNINTQKKIADMIINITKKISIENKKLDNLNILKQSLLQQMFI